MTSDSPNKRNISAILGFEALWGFSAPFVLVTTILPGYLDALGLSKLLIGMVPALFYGGIALVQPFSLYLIQPGPNRLNKTLRTYRIAGLCFIAMAISALLLPAEAVLLRSLAFFICLLGFVVTVGVGDPHYIAAIMDSIDARQRGWFFGLRYVYFGGGGLAAGALASGLLGMLPPPYSFGLSILVGGGIILVATSWLARLKPIASAEEESKPSIADCFNGIIRMAKGNRRFQLFLAVVSLFVLMQGAAAFIVLSIKARLHAGDSVLGWLGSVEMAAGVVLSLLLGHIGDRLGYKRAFMVGAVLYLVGMSAVYFGSSQWLLFVGYFFTSVLMPTTVVAGFHLGCECSGETDMGKVYAGISVAEAPCRIAGPILVGMVVQESGYTPVFAAAAALAVAAFILLAAIPRK